MRMKTSNGTHAYRRQCIASALDLANGVPGPNVFLPRDGDEIEPNLPPEQLDALEKEEERQRFIVSVTAAIDHRRCPRCGRKLPKRPVGSVITPCRCVPLCVRCHRLEQYWVAGTLVLHWLDDRREDEELLRSLDSLAEMRAALDDRISLPPED